LRGHWDHLEESLSDCDKRIHTSVTLDERCIRLRAVPGVGPITADALVATVGDARAFKNGRQMAAWLGLVPSQYSSGGKIRLGAITRRGDDYLRTLLIQGARSAINQANRVAPGKATPEQQWIRQLGTRMCFGKQLVAIANKHARQLWSILAKGVDYDPYAVELIPVFRASEGAKEQMTL